jgi:hypothetical protein
MGVFKAESDNFYKVNAAVRYCNDILLNPEKELHFFISTIQQKDFDMSTLSGAEIANRIVAFLNSGQQINIKFYRSKNPWSKAYGYYSPSRPFDVNINTRHIVRSTESFIETIVHELIHAIDGLDLENSFGHGDNSRKGKHNTAPYWIGVLATSFYNWGASVNEHMVRHTFEDAPTKIYTPWYYKLWGWIKRRL